MPRIRTIQPHFPRSTSMTRVSRDARLLFVQLWLAADDAGRLRAAPLALAAQLYPADPDALALLAPWLDELEREDCIERYAVEGADYLRIVNWRAYQTIQHSTASRLPLSPAEEHARRSRKSREAARILRESEANSLNARGNSGASAEFHEENFDTEPPPPAPPITPDLLVDEVWGIMRHARARGTSTPALQAAKMLGQNIGLWLSGRRSAKEASTAPRTRPLSEIVP